MNPQHPLRMTRLCTSALAVALLVVCLRAAAHTGDKGLATITVSGTGVTYNYWLPMMSVSPALAQAMHLNQPGVEPDYRPVLAAIEGSIHIEADGRPCPAAPGVLTAPSQAGGNIAVLLQFTCPNTPAWLNVRDDLADVFANDYVTIANIQWRGGSRQALFRASEREARILLAASGSASATTGFLRLGIEHILFGFDHLLFLLALVLRGGKLWSLLKIVTAFTIAHSITLALAVFNVLVLPDRIVQAVIALSIAYVAAENLFMQRPVSHRWAVSFVFGLVHGIGFASVLRELQLPAREVIWPLLAFNLGVEAGQATAVAVALPLLIWARQFKWEPRAVAALSLVVLVVGLGLFFERVVA